MKARRKYGSVVSVIIRAIEDNPTFDAYQIASIANCSHEYVRTIVQRRNVKVAKKHKIKGESASTLGRYAKAAGMTLADIEEWKNARKIKNGKG